MYPLDIAYYAYISTYDDLLPGAINNFKSLVSREIYQGDDLICGVLLLYKYQHKLYDLIVSEKFHVKYGMIIFEYLCVNMNSRNVKNILFNKTLDKDEIMK